MLNAFSLSDFVKAAAAPLAPPHIPRRAGAFAARRRCSLPALRPASLRSWVSVLKESRRESPRPPAAEPAAGAPVPTTGTPPPPPPATPLAFGLRLRAALWPCVATLLRPPRRPPPCPHTSLRRQARGANTPTPPPKFSSAKRPPRLPLRATPRGRVPLRSTPPRSVALRRQPTRAYFTSKGRGGRRRPFGGVALGRPSCTPQLSKTGVENTSPHLFHVEHRAALPLRPPLTGSLDPLP